MSAVSSAQPNLAWTPIGEWPAGRAIPVLEAAGAQESADRIAELVADSGNDLTAASHLESFQALWGGGGGMFAGTAHAFGFIPAGEFTSADPLPIRNAGNMEPDLSLRDGRVKVTLDRLVALDYPGDGRHQVLIEFAGSHQTRDQSEQVRYAHTYAVQEHEGAGIVGYPIFIGLSVGKEGVAFRVTTRNVSNDDDRKLLALLEGEAFTQGLKLLHAAEPALAPLTGFAKVVGETFARRNENILVQQFDMGLDFEPAAGRARLAQGTYLAAQIGRDRIDWNDWEYHPDRAQVLRKGRPDFALPYNHIAFSVSAYQE